MCMFLGRRKSAPWLASNITVEENGVRNIDQVHGIVELAILLRPFLWPSLWLSVLTLNELPSSRRQRPLSKNNENVSPSPICCLQNKFCLSCQCCDQHLMFCSCWRKSCRLLSVIKVVFALRGYPIDDSKVALSTNFNMTPLRKINF